MDGLLFNIQKFSTHDGPGIRTTVFLKGCPLRCKWCSNPESQKRIIEITYDKDRCVYCHRCIEENPDLDLKFEDGVLLIPQDLTEEDKNFTQSCRHHALITEGEKKTVEEVIETCLQDELFYEESGGGVTISGGEGMSQPDFVRELVERLKSHKIPLAIETTGAVSPEIFQDLAPRFDLLLYDLKHYDSHSHREGTGMGNEQILENLKWAIKKELPVTIRIPVIPDFNSSLEDAKAFSHLLNKLGARRVELLPFHQFGQKKYERLGRDYAYNSYKALYPEDLKEYQEIFIANGIDATFD